MTALNEANRIRAVRANLKKDLKAGKKSVYDILRNPHNDVKTMKLLDLMLAVPKYGRVKVDKVLKLTRISPSKTLSGLSDRQRSELVSMLRRYPDV